MSWISQDTSWGRGNRYFGKLTHDQRNDYTSQRVIQWVDDEYESSHYQFAGTKKEESKQNRVGFKTGLGFEMNLTSSIALGLEGFGRIINFNN
jgi:opacity protein-like surface antigen